MSDRIRSAVIGAGFIGTVHARAVRAAGGDLVAVADSNQGSAAAERLAADRAAASWQEIVAANDVDVVHICTPNHLHAPIAQAALAAGKHVICEKPLSIDVESALAVAEAAGAAGVVAAVPFVYRFYPTVRDARARFQRGDLGDLRLLHGTYLQDWLSRPDDGNWRVDPALGGPSRAFGDIGVHWCDLAEFVTGQRIVSLSAQLFRIPRPRGAALTEDGGVVTFRTGGGVLGSVVISQVSPGRKNRLWLGIDCSEASVAFDQESPDALWIGGRPHNVVVPRGAESSAPESKPYDLVPVGHPQGYLDCFTSFVSDVYAAVRGTVPDGLPTFDDGLRAARLTTSVLESAVSGSWVDVPTESVLN
jgi:predicted dehydrogenase